MTMHRAMLARAAMLGLAGVVLGFLLAVAAATL